MKSAFSGWRYLWKSEDIRRKLLITLGILGALSSRRKRSGSRRGLHGPQGFPLQRRWHGWLSWDSLICSPVAPSRISRLLSMGVYPYITAQIILQLLIPIIPALQRRMQEDPREGRQWMERWTYFLAVPMAALSAIGQINIFNSLSVQALNQVILPFGFSSDLWLHFHDGTAGDDRWHHVCHLARRIDFGVWHSGTGAFAGDLRGNRGSHAGQSRSLACGSLLPHFS